MLHQLGIDEGNRPKPYKDTVGKLTIGIGRNLDDVGLSPNEIEFMARNDIERAAGILDRIISEWRTFTEPRQQALINMAFNLGNRLAGFDQMLSALRMHDWEQAAHEAENSLWAKQVGDRAKRIARMIRGT